MNLPIELIQIILDFSFGPDAWSLVYTCKEYCSMQPRYKDKYKMFDVFNLKRDEKTYRKLALHGVVEPFRSYFIPSISFKSLYYYACRSGNEELMDMLRPASSCPDTDMDCARCMRGEMPHSRSRHVLHFVGLSGNVNLINKIIRTSQSGKDAILNGACKGGHYTVVAYLLARGFTSNNALWYAIKGKNRDIIALFINQGSASDGLRAAAEVGDLETTSTLIKRVNQSAKVNAFYAACSKGHLDIIDLCIQNGVHCYKKGISVAIKGGQKEVIRKLQCL